MATTGYTPPADVAGKRQLLLIVFLLGTFLGVSPLHEPLLNLLLLCLLLSLPILQRRAAVASVCAQVRVHSCIDKDIATSGRQDCLTSQTAARRVWKVWVHTLMDMTNLCEAGREKQQQRDGHTELAVTHATEA